MTIVLIFTSLGLTLYYLANNQKFPSCNRYREEIAPIEGVNPELNRILLKACALSAGNRYSEASEMKTDLQILYQAVGKKKGRRESANLIAKDTRRKVQSRK